MAPKLGILEIEDFKTYFGKHVVGPLQSFTAVIGPNGGGKSNLMDAVAFVLGEQLEAMRVKQWKELIHREKVNSDGESASPGVTASVTAIFTLDDGGEKAFKRLVSSEGSTFLVDGQLVQFGTYQENLQNLGISVKCRNFMVFQGRVELIATYGSREKIELFEEISGSKEFRCEYNRLKTKLDKAEGELSVEFEKLNIVKDQYNDLKKDRKEEKLYESLERKCKEINIKLQLFRLHYIGSEQQSLQMEMEIKENAIKDLEEKERKQTQLVKEKLENQTVTLQDVISMEQELGELEIRLRKKKSEVVTAKECLAERKNKNDICIKLLSKAKLAQENHRKKLDDLENERTKMEDLAAQYEERISEEASMIGQSVELEGEQLRQYHQLKQQVGQCCSSLQQKMDWFSRQVRTQHDQLANENRKVEERQEALGRKEKEVQELKRRRENLTDRLKVMQQSVGEKQQRLKEMERGVTCKRDNLMKLKADLETLTLQLNEADLEVDQTNRQCRKQEVLEQLQNKFPGVYDRLGNLCEPIHPRYKLAITRVIIKHLDSIVVDTEATARWCMKYLMDKMIGRETFLPINYLQAEPLKESLRAIQEPQHVKLAFDLIKFKAPYVKVAAMFATNNVLVCETPEDAMKVAYEIHTSNLSAVALDGTFYSKSGLMSGGKLELEKKAKCWSEKNVAKMKSNKDKIIEELRKAQSLSREESEMKSLRVQVEGQEAQVKYASVELEQFPKQIEKMEEHLLEMQNELKIHTDNCKELKAAIAERDTEILKINEEMRKKENEIFKEFCQEIGVPDIRHYEQGSLQVSMDREKERLKFEKQKSRIISLMSYEKSKDMEADVKKWESIITSHTEALDKAKEKEKEKISELLAAEALVVDGRSELVKKQQASREAQKMVEAAQEKTRVLRRESGKMQYRILNVKQKIAAHKAKRQAILQQCHIKDVQLPLLSGSLQQATRQEVDSFTSSLSETSSGQNEAIVEVDFSSLSTSYKQPENEEVRNQLEGDLVSELSNLQERLANIQPPKKNTRQLLMELDQQVQAMRVSWKEKQRRAKDVKQSFQDIKEQRYTLFMECFTSVSAKIDKIYKIICQDTSAQALLETDNQEEPYLGSIVYHCIPPGKRFQSMWDLSGGEKAMASLAFLFALHRYNPAPFFILDEVDTALDKINIRKVTSYLRRRKEEVQILVISHKENLYNKADALIGITCRTSGHSRVYSLDMTQYRRRRRQPEQIPASDIGMEIQEAV